MRRTCLVAFVSALLPTCSRPQPSGPPTSEVTAVQAPGFAFESQPGPLPAALAAAASAYAAPSSTQQELDANQRALADARTMIQTDPAAATALVLGELAATDPANEARRGLLLFLLAETSTADALAKLAELALAPVRGEGGSEPDFALGQIRRAATLGRANARATLIDVAVRATNVAVKRSAIEALYAASPSHFRARQELARRLPASERYLVYQAL